MCGEVGSCRSYLVYLLRDDDGVVAADLLRAELPVVERALVLVAVPVHGAEQPSAAALEPYHNNHHKLRLTTSYTQGPHRTHRQLFKTSKEICLYKLLHI